MSTLNASPMPLANAAGHRASMAMQPTPVQMDSSALLQGQKTVHIVHNGATYRLQATKLGKLILTK